MLIGIDASRAARTQLTGTEAYSLNLIRALVEIGHRHRFHLYTPAAFPPHPHFQHLPQNVEIRVIPFPRMWTHVRLTGELLRCPPDVLFVPSHVMPIFCRVPAVVTVHDLGYLRFPEAHRRRDRWYLDWTTRRHAHKAAGLIADSIATRQDLIDCYGADPSRIDVIYPGRDESLARVDDQTQIAAAKARYGIEGDYLLYLGTIQPRKNLVRLVEAYAQMLETSFPNRAPTRSSNGKDSAPRLVLAGKSGWLERDLYECIAALGVEDKVILTGFVHDENKAALLSGALALVFPSLYEGFGLPVLEAMACGTPVLTSTTSSLPEVAGDAALLVDPLDTGAIASAIGRLIHEPGLRQELVEKGYRRLSEFSWNRAAHQTLDLLERAVVGPGGGRYGD